MLLSQALKRCFTKAKYSTLPFSSHAISKRFTTSSSPSPLLMLPASEAAAAAAAPSSYNPSNIYIIRQSCFYNVQTQRFLTKGEVKDAAEIDEQQAHNLEPAMLYRSTNGQLIYLDLMQNFFHPRIVNPFDLEYFKLPLIEKLPEGLVGYKFRELGDGTLEMSGSVRKNDGSCVRITKSLDDYIAGEVVVSPKGVVMMLNGKHSKLSYLRLGEDDWKILEESSNDWKFKGLLFGQDDQRFYSILSVGPRGDVEVQSWDFCEPCNPKKESYLITWGEGEIGGSYTPYDLKLRKYTQKATYFAELSGEIHIIVRYFAWHVTEDAKILRCESDMSCKYPYKTVACDVMKLDPVKKMLVQIESLGDKALFLGLNDPFVLSASEFPGIMPDSIYFTDNLYRLQALHPHPDFDEDEYPFGGHDCVIFSLRDGTITQCYQTDSKKIWPSPIWIAPH